MTFSFSFLSVDLPPAPRSSSRRLHLSFLSSFLKWRAKHFALVLLTTEGCSPRPRSSKYTCSTTCYLSRFCTLLCQLFKPRPLLYLFPCDFRTTSLLHVCVGHHHSCFKLALSYGPQTSYCTDMKSITYADLFQ